MRSRALAVLTVALLTVGAIAAGATASGAAAREVTVTDPARDVERMSFDGETSPAPDTRAGDVRRARFRYGNANIVIRLKYVDLRRIGQYAQYLARIQNGQKNRYREVQVEASKRSWRGKATVFDRRGNRVACDARHWIDYGADTVVMSVPRACLGGPAKVRASARSFWADRESQSFLMDNPHTSGAAVTWTRWLRRG